MLKHVPVNLKSPFNGHTWSVTNQDGSKLDPKHYKITYDNELKNIVHININKHGLYTVLCDPVEPENAVGNCKAKINVTYAKKFSESAKATTTLTKNMKEKDFQKSLKLQFSPIDLPTKEDVLKKVTKLVEVKEITQADIEGWGFSSFDNFMETKAKEAHKLINIQKNYQEAQNKISKTLQQKLKDANPKISFSGQYSYIRGNRMTAGDWSSPKGIWDKLDISSQRETEINLSPEFDITTDGRIKLTTAQLTQVKLLVGIELLAIGKPSFVTRKRNPYTFTQLLPKIRLTFKEFRKNKEGEWKQKWKIVSDRNLPYVKAKLTADPRTITLAE